MRLFDGAVDDRLAAPRRELPLRTGLRVWTAPRLIQPADQRAATNRRHEEGRGARREQTGADPIEHAASMAPTRRVSEP
jgi:hypothetical protein